MKEGQLIYMLQIDGKLTVIIWVEQDVSFFVFLFILNAGDCTSKKTQQHHLFHLEPRKWKLKTSHGHSKMPMTKEVSQAG